MNYDKLKQAAREYAKRPTGDICESRTIAFIEGAEWARNYYASQYFQSQSNSQKLAPEEDWTPIDPNTGLRDRRI